MIDQFYARLCDIGNRARTYKADGLHGARVLLAEIQEANRGLGTILIHSRSRNSAKSTAALEKIEDQLDELVTTISCFIVGLEGSS